MRSPTGASADVACCAPSAAYKSATDYPERDLTDEFKGAQFRDAMPEVRVWVRNLPRKATSFCLRTFKDWVHPDFICQLTDARVLAVEYKGKHPYDAGGEKRAVCAVWSPFPRVSLRRTHTSA